MNDRKKISIVLLVVAAYIALVNLVLLCLNTNHLTETEIFFYKVTLIAMNIFLVVSLVYRITIEPAIATPIYYGLLFTIIGFTLLAFLLMTCVAYHYWFLYKWGKGDTISADPSEIRNLRHSAYTTYVLCLLVAVIGALSISEIRCKDRFEEATITTQPSAQAPSQSRPQTPSRSPSCRASCLASPSPSPSMSTSQSRQTFSTKIT